VTIFLTSHDAGDVEVLCKRAMVINHGEVIYDGRVSALKHDCIRVADITVDDPPMEEIIAKIYEAGEAAS
jgi:ABC-2 type transport system ATP-binding protein